MIVQQPTESAVIQTLFQMSGITKEKVEKQLEELIIEASRPKLLFWDVEQISQATSFKKTFLEEHILCDPRVKRYERKRGPYSKRVWLYEPSAKAIQDIIMNEWI